MCAGYYNYQQGHVPDCRDGTFRGPVIHPQHWPDDLDYEKKRIVVAGSGATAITLVPALAEKREVVMLQRSPTYVAAMPRQDKFANTLKALLPSNVAYALTRKEHCVSAIGLQDCSIPSEMVEESVAQALNPRWDPRWMLSGILCRATTRGRSACVSLLMAISLRY